MALLLPELVGSPSIPRLPGQAKFGSSLTPGVVRVWVHDDNACGKKRVLPILLRHVLLGSPLDFSLAAVVWVLEMGVLVLVCRVSKAVGTARWWFWNLFAGARSKELAEVTDVTWAIHPSMSAVPHIVLSEKNPKVAMTEGTEQHHDAVWKVGAVILMLSMLKHNFPLLTLLLSSSSQLSFSSGNGCLGSFDTSFSLILT